jgi:hypothetical protein
VVTSSLGATFFFGGYFIVISIQNWRIFVDSKVVVREGGSLYHIERDERVGLDGRFGGLHLKVPRMLIVTAFDCHSI